MPLEFHPRHHNCLLCGKPHTLFGLFCSAVHRDAYEAAGQLRELGDERPVVETLVEHFRKYTHPPTEGVLKAMLIGVTGVVDVAIIQDHPGEVSIGLRLAEGHDGWWLSDIERALDTVRPAGVFFRVYLVDCICHETVYGKECPIHARP